MATPSLKNWEWPLGSCRSILEVVMYVCSICNLFAGQSFSTVLRHMGTHRYDAGLNIRCGINSCVQQYKNFESFRSHVYRKHREALVQAPNASATQAIVNGGVNLDEDEMDQGDREVDSCESNGDTNDDPKRLAALFLLKTLEDRKVTQVTLDGIVQDFRGIWRDSMERLKVSLDWTLLLYGQNFLLLYSYTSVRC